MQIDLLTYTPRPLDVLYTAYRVCYSKFSGQEIWEKLSSGNISVEERDTFLTKMFNTGHSSPLRQIYFTFAITGITRACSHQFVRHTVGIGHDQQSQRYCDAKHFDFVEPADIAKDEVLSDRFNSFLSTIATEYQFYLDQGINKEDARAILPNATTTNLTTTFSYEALIHFCNLRLCTRAQKEIRHLARDLAAEVRKVEPFLVKKLVIKCMPNGKLGMCDEMLKDYNECSMSKVVPHKDTLIQLWRNNRR